MNVEFTKTHDLVHLLELAKPLVPELEAYREVFAEMSNYSIQARYPDIPFEPGRDDVVRSLRIAEEVVTRIRQKVLES